jgi:hypothetical protein
MTEQRGQGCGCLHPVPALCRPCLWPSCPVDTVIADPPPPACLNTTTSVWFPKPRANTLAQPGVCHPHTQWEAVSGPNLDPFPPFLTCHLCHTTFWHLTSIVCQVHLVSSAHLPTSSAWVFIPYSIKTSQGQAPQYTPIISAAWEAETGKFEASQGKNLARPHINRQTRCGSAHI